MEPMRTLKSIDNSTTCCRPLKRAIVGGLGLVLAGVIFVGGLWMGRQQSAPGFNPAPLMLDATASDTNGSFTIATGAVGKSAEGLFMLDHESGLLQCHVIYPRIGRMGASFATNVKDVLPGGGKGGGYIMVTGLAEFPGGSNQPLGAGAVVYVMDTSSGAYACYGVPFDRVAENAGRPQQNALVVLATGEARQVVERDNLR
ncbi:hypothetical protein FF011L_06670 [Roseimaritima multifibrata]|uniref:Uncharacterized protein n=2 Tax=Roseimaritima multifibrata TaxID=1930274 RepID=A0A517MAQ0_9BACT|nr:hypothetical protein FF011L_06670 [Roseimaritima multifibrata]